MSQYDQVVAAIHRRSGSPRTARSSQQLVEAGFFSSLVLAPFKVLFYGAMFMFKVIGVIVAVVGVGTIGIGFLIWYLTRWATGKIKSWNDAKRLDPRKAEGAKKCAAEIAGSLKDPRVVNELRSNPKAADVLYGAMDSLGQGEAATASCIAVACASLPDDGIVTADWQAFFEGPIFVGLAFAVSAVVGGPGFALTSLLWFMAGLATHKWATASEANRHDSSKTSAAKKAAQKVAKNLNHPKIREAVRKSPQAATLLDKTIKALS